MTAKTYYRIFFKKNLPSHTSAHMGQSMSTVIKICVNAIKSIHFFTRESKGAVRSLFPHRSEFIVMMNTYSRRQGHFQGAGENSDFKARGSAVTTCTFFHLQILLRPGSNQKWFSYRNVFHRAVKLILQETVLQIIWPGS